MTDLEPTQHDVVADAVERLTLAAASGVASPPVRELLGWTDIALAYRVQNTLTMNRLATGARIVGRKIGLTSPGVQRQLGVDQPDFGVLFDDMMIADGAEVDSSKLIQPKVEAEIAFVLSADLDGSATSADLDAPISAADRDAAGAAVRYAVAALEIVDSRVTNWDISITDTIADNASSGLFVLGIQRLSLTEVNPVEVTMTLDKNGERASAGDGAASLGDPLNALAWLARTAAAFGAPLRAGDIVLSGALGPMVTAEPGSRITATLSALGRVSVTFSQ